ncbi:MAG: monovalent cation/H(+) antiporter subunit G [Gammaproteobacteria bacterium]|nr:monovalent cation/H(+) antiporter subunit G [Gammaproteobacteria bacterium]
MSGVTVTIGLVFVVVGTVVMTIGTLALLRFPDPLSRLHALTKADNLGLGLCVLGLALVAGELRSGLLMLMIWAVVLLASATSAQLIARGYLSRMDVRHD